MPSDFIKDSTVDLSNVKNYDNDIQLLNVKTSANSSFWSELYYRYVSELNNNEEQRNQLLLELILDNDNYLSKLLFNKTDIRDSASESFNLFKKDINNLVKDFNDLNKDVFKKFESDVIKIINEAAQRFKETEKSIRDAQIAKQNLTNNDNDKLNNSVIEKPPVKKNSRISKNNNINLFNITSFINIGKFKKTISAIDKLQNKLKSQTTIPKNIEITNKIQTTNSLVPNVLAEQNKDLLIDKKTNNKDKILRQQMPADIKQSTKRKLKKHTYSRISRILSITLNKISKPLLILFKKIKLFLKQYIWIVKAIDFSIRTISFLIKTIKLLSSGMLGILKISYDVISKTLSKIFPKKTLIILLTGFFMSKPGAMIIGYIAGAIKKIKDYIVDKTETAKKIFESINIESISQRFKEMANNLSAAAADSNLRSNVSKLAGIIENFKKLNWIKEKEDKLRDQKVDDAVKNGTEHTSIFESILGIALSILGMGPAIVLSIGSSVVEFTARKTGLKFLSNAMLGGRYKTYAGRVFKTEIANELINKELKTYQELYRPHSGKSGVAAHYTSDKSFFNKTTPIKPVSPNITPITAGDRVIKGQTISSYNSSLIENLIKTLENEQKKYVINNADESKKQTFGPIAIKPPNVLTDRQAQLDKQTDKIKDIETSWWRWPEKKLADIQSVIEKDNFNLSSANLAKIKDHDFGMLLLKYKQDVIPKHFLTASGNDSEIKYLMNLASPQGYNLNNYFLEPDNSNITSRKYAIMDLESLYENWASNMVSFYGNEFFTELNYKTRILLNKGSQNAKFLENTYSMLRDKIPYDQFDFSMGAMELNRDIFNMILRILVSDKSFFISNIYRLLPNNHLLKDIIKNSYKKIYDINITSNLFYNINYLWQRAIKNLDDMRVAGMWIQKIGNIFKETARFENINNFLNDLIVNLNHELSEKYANNASQINITDEYKKFLKLDSVDLHNYFSLSNVEKYFSLDDINKALDGNFQNISDIFIEMRGNDDIVINYMAKQLEPLNKDLKNGWLIEIINRLKERKKELIRASELETRRRSTGKIDSKTGEFIGISYEESRELEMLRNGGLIENDPPAY